MTHNCCTSKAIIYLTDGYSYSTTPFIDDSGCTWELYKDCYTVASGVEANRELAAGAAKEEYTARLLGEQIAANDRRLFDILLGQ
jgi:hypothetical protein